MGINKEESIENKLNININTIMTWCNNAGLQIAKEKMEIILLTGMQILKIINVNIINTLITTNNTIIYLGLTIDKIRNYTADLETVCGRADAFSQSVDSTTSQHKWSH